MPRKSLKQEIEKQLFPKEDYGSILVVVYTNDSKSRDVPLRGGKPTRVYLTKNKRSGHLKNMVKVENKKGRWYIVNA